MSEVSAENTPGGPLSVSPKQQLAATAGAALVALAFLAAGGAKLLGLQFERDAFALFQLPTWLMYQVGAVEIAAAVLLNIRKTSSFGAVVGTAVMSVAAPAHIAAGEAPKAVVPVAVAGMLVFVGWTRRLDLVDWLTAR